MRHFIKTGHILTSAMACLMIFSSGSASQVPSPTPATTTDKTDKKAVLDLQLNTLDATDKGCRLSFVITNKLGAILDKAAYEMVLFNAEKRVERLALLEFKDLPPEKTKVIRFNLADVECNKISRVLINDATSCEAANLAPDVCIRQLKTSVQTGIEFGL